MSGRWGRFVPLTGVVFVALLVVGSLLGGSTPGSGATGAKVISYYHSHGTKIQAEAILTGLSLFVGLFFYASLRDYLRRADAAQRLAGTAFGGAVLFAVGGALSAGAQMSLADVPDKLSPAAAQALNVLNNDLAQFALLAGIAVLMVAAGIAIIRTRSLPVWFGWFAIVIAVVALTPAGFFGFIATGLWTLIASILIYLRQDETPRQAPGSTVAATPAS